MGHSCKFEVGIHGHSWEFMGIHVLSCARACDDALFSLRFCCKKRNRSSLGKREMSSELSSIIILLVWERGGHKETAIPSIVLEF